MKKNIFWSDELLANIDTAKKCLPYLRKKPLSTKSLSVTAKKISRLIKKADTTEFQIAFVGTIKAGKSTLINALLHGQYASTSAAPETAVLTRFGDSGCDDFFLEVQYYQINEWEAIWKQIVSARDSSDPDIRDRIRPFLEEYERLGAEQVKASCLNRKKERKIFLSPEELMKGIAEYTSSQSDIHYFVKEVYVGIRNSGLPERVVICDTPGLDDVLEYRSNVTKRYIDSANATIICVESSFLGGEQLHTIQSVFGLNRFHPERVFIAGTKTDKLSNPQQDWQIQKDTWIQYLQGSACYGSRELAEKNIIGVSASIEQLASDMDQVAFMSKDYFCLCAYACSFGLNPASIMEPETNRALRDYAAVTTLMEILRERIFAVYKQAMEEQLTEEFELLKQEMIVKIKWFVERKADLYDKLQAASSSWSDMIEEAKKEQEHYEAVKTEFEEVYRELRHNECIVQEHIGHRLDSLLEMRGYE